MLASIGGAALGTGAIFLMTTLGAAVVFFFHGDPRPGSLKAMLGFAAGIMTAASVWSLLIPAMEQASGRIPDWIQASAGMLAGCVCLGVLDAVIPRLRRGAGSDPSWRRTALLLGAITLHNVPEGMAVGLACGLAVRTGDALPAAVLTLGVGVQNFPEGAAVSLPLRQEGWGRGKAFLGGTFSGAVEPLFGIGAAAAASYADPLMPWLLSFAAGAMLYVVAEELIPQAHSRAGTWGYLGGFLLMMALDTALG